MTPRRRAAAVLRRLRCAEDGIALPVTMLATGIGMAFAGVVIVASVNTQSGSVRAHSSNAALAAADAGLNVAILRQNQLMPTTSQCAVVSGGKLVPQSGVQTNGWCPPVELTPATTPAAPPGSTIVYRVKPACETSTSGSTTKITMCVVSTATALAGGRTVSRRVELKATSESTTTTIPGESTKPVNPFQFGQVVGIESLYLRGNSKIYHGGAASNGQVQIIDSSKVCGGLRYGAGTLPPVGREDQVKWVYPESERPYSNGTGGGVCSGEKPTTGTVTYENVSLPSNISTINSNARLTNKQDAAVSDCGQKFCNISWNASNRALTINYGSLRMEGTSPYYLCQLTLTGGSTLRTVAGRRLRIFFDEPKNCAGLNGAAQLVINGGTKVEADGVGGPGFYLRGASTNPSSSKVYFGNGAASANLVIYAPNSAVEVAGGINLNGAILGRTMKIEGGANINPNVPWTPPLPEDYLPPGKESPPTTTTTTTPFGRTAFIECSAQPTTASDPGSGC